MFGMSISWIIVALALVILWVVAKQKSNLTQDLKKAKSRLYSAETFVKFVSHSVEGKKTEWTSGLLSQFNVQNAPDIINSLYFLCAINSATSSMRNAANSCKHESVADVAEHIRNMVATANSMVLTVNELLGVNAHQMLEDLKGIEHTGNVSEVKKIVGEANKTLIKIFGEFQRVNDQMASLCVTRAEAGISDSDPLAGFLDMAQKIDDAGGFTNNDTVSDNEQ